MAKQAAKRTELPGQGSATSCGGGPSQSPSHDAAPAIVSEEMVAAGVRVLWQSGAVEGQLGSDELLVADIFRAMFAVLDTSKGSERIR